MPTTVRPPRTRLAIALIVGMLAVSVTPMVSVQAESGDYSFLGHVYEGTEIPLEGARLTLAPENGSSPARVTTTDGAGAYRFDDVSKGRYRISANHTCCQRTSAPVKILGGTQLERELDVHLEPRETANETVRLQGTVREKNTGEPIPGARLLIDNYPATGFVKTETNTSVLEPEPIRWNFTADENGAYAVDLEPGGVRLVAETHGYFHTRASLRMDGDRELDIPMGAKNVSAVQIRGTVRSDTGEPIPGVQVKVNVQGEDASDGTQETERDGVRFQVHAPARTFDSDRTDENGRFRMTTLPGSLLLRASKAGYLDGSRQLEVQQGGTVHANVTLDPIPGESVTVQGTVRDAASGEPVPWARITVENQRWGHRNGTYSDEDGRFELATKPGYTIATVRAGENGLRPCPSEEGEVVDEPSRTTSDDGTEDAPSRSGGCAVERDHAYLQRSLAFVGTEGDEQQLEIRLEQADAVLEGRVVNASSEEGVPEAQIHLRNELSGDRSQTITAANGSFRVELSAGYHTLGVRADGYFEGVSNLWIGPGEVKTQTLELTPGEPRRGSCCAVLPDGDVSADDTRDTTREDSVPPTRSGGPEGPADANAGQAADPRASNGSDGGNETPTLDLVGTLAVAGTVALVAKRRTGPLGLGGPQPAPGSILTSSSNRFRSPSSVRSSLVNRIDSSWLPSERSTVVACSDQPPADGSASSTVRPSTWTTMCGATPSSSWPFARIERSYDPASAMSSSSVRWPSVHRFHRSFADADPSSCRSPSLRVVKLSASSEVVPELGTGTPLEPLEPSALEPPLDAPWTPSIQTSRAGFSLPSSRTRPQCFSASP